MICIGKKIWGWVLYLLSKKYPIEIESSSIIYDSSPHHSKREIDIGGKELQSRYCCILIPMDVDVDVDDWYNAAL